jgi:hypothetical protein
MNPLIVIGLLSLIPVALIILMRVNAAMVFLSLCVGSITAQYLGDDTDRIFNSFLPNSSVAIQAAVRIGLFLLPALLTIIFLRRSVHGHKYIFNVLPAVLTGAVTAILVVPLLPDGTKYAITTSSLWTSTQQFQSTIVGAAVLICLLQLWTTHPTGPRGGRLRHK